jgi:hypothetical protein
MEVIATENMLRIFSRILYSINYQKVIEIER